MMDLPFLGGLFKNLKKEVSSHVEDPTIWTQKHFGFPKSVKAGTEENGTNLVRILRTEFAVQSSVSE